MAGIEPRGSTDLEGGWRRGCEQVVEHLSAEAVGRCLLLTDGLANAGVTDHDEIERRAEGWRGPARRHEQPSASARASTRRSSAAMADAGGGNFEFIESAVQIADFVASEVGEALAVAAREAVLVVEAGEGAVVESLNDFPCRRDGTAWRVEIGSLLRRPVPEPRPARHAAGGRGRSRARRDRAARGRRRGARPADGRRAVHRERATRRTTASPGTARWTAAWRRSTPPAPSATRSRGTARTTSRRARRILERCIRRIQGYAGDDAEILAVVEDLRGKVARYGRDMDALTRKSFYSTSHRSLKERSIEKERRRRRPPARVSLLASHRLAGLLDPVIAHLAATDAGPLRGPGTRRRANPRAGRRGPPRPGRGGPAARRRSSPDALPASIRILFTAQRLSDNWFSHWHGDRRAAIVSLDGWDGSFGVPAEAFVAYEVIHHGLRLLGPAWEPERLAHAETRGCLFDFCAHRADVDIKLQAADFCPSCHAALAAAGLPMGRLQRLAEVVRTLAVPARVVH